MGGAEMYTNNKVKYLISTGWKVKVCFYVTAENVRLDGLLPFVGNCNSEMSLPLNFYSRNKREDIINKIIGDYTLSEETIVESHLPHLSIWAELVAKKLKGRHIVNCIQEQPIDQTPRLAQYYEFKLKRREILNATEKSLQIRYFVNYYKPEYAQYTHNAKIICSNVVTDDIAPQVVLEKSNYNIVTIGRLDKAYVPTMLEEVRSFVAANGDKKFNFIVVGGSPGGRVESEVASFFQNTENIKVYTLGYVFPIPGALLDCCDVSIASANSIYVSYERGIPTIAVCAYDYQGMGIFGETTQSIVIRKNEPQIPIRELLDDVLIKGKYKKKSLVEKKENESNLVLQEQIEYIENSKEKKEYYEVDRIYSKSSFIINRIKLLFHNIKN